MSEAGTNGQERRINVPQPPPGTANYGYEFQIAMWRERITDAVYDTRDRIAEYQAAEDKRHAEVIKTIEAQGSYWRAAWGAVEACTRGTLEIARTVAGNLTSESNAKYFALILLGLAAILNGIAFSGWGFEAGGTRCGPGTIEQDGSCVPDLRLVE